MRKPLTRPQREAAAVLLCALAIALIFATGVLHRRKVWSAMHSHELTFPDGYSMRAENGDPYGVQNTSAALTLAKGTYQFRCRIETDGECAVRFVAKNSARISPAEVVIGPDEPLTTVELDILDNADSVMILVDWRSGSRLDIYDMRLYTRKFADHAFTASFLLAAACLLCILYGRGVLTRGGMGRLIVIGIAVTVVSAPALKASFSYGHDGVFHAARLTNLADALASGQFPARVGGFTYNGYGAITSAFYPDLLLYPLAGMIIAGASPAYVLNVLCIGETILAAACMYACARRILGDGTAAVCACVLYVCAPYRLDDVFIRSAVGEALGMSLLPLFLLGLWEVFLGEERRWPLLSLSAFAIFMSHILSALMCAMLAVGMGALCLPRLVKKPARLLACAKAAIVTALLSAFFLVPLLDLMGQGLNADIINLYQLETTTRSPAQLFSMSTGDIPGDPADGTISYHAIELGLPIVLGCAWMLHAFVTADDRRDRRLRAGMLLLGMGAVFALMCTTLFPWNYVTAVTGLFDRMQFAWRLLAPASMLLALASGWGYRCLAPGHEAQLTAALTAFALAIVLPLTTSHTRADGLLLFGEGADSEIIYTEYTLPGTQNASPRDYAFAAEDSVSVSEYEKDGTRITAHIASEAGGSVSFPLFCYDGYRAELGGEPIAVYPGENNRLTLDVPAGADGELHIRYAIKPLWRAGDCVSLLTAAALCARGIAVHRRKRRNARA